MRHLVKLSVALLLFAGTLAAEDKPLLVYILAGQSNMDGHAKVSTFDYMREDPVTAPILEDMLGPDGKPKVCDDVWISLYTGNRELGEVHGKLTAGYGARLKFNESEDKIGPEFTFGIYMQKHVRQPILIIKTSWGGKSLNTDFRPPSAGIYELPEVTRKRWEESPDGGHGIPPEGERAEWWKQKHTATGVYYRMMIGHVKSVLRDIERVCPAYDPKAGYKLAGFVWFQAWNDLFDGRTYPEPGKPGGFDLYAEVLGHFIRDVRKDLGAPKMPFVIGVCGVGGEEEDSGRFRRQIEFRKAMAKPASLPEFKGNVFAVQTAPFWDKKLGAIELKLGQVKQMKYLLRNKNANSANADGTMTPAQQKEYMKEYEAELISPAEKALWERGASNGGYHYMGSAKIVAQIGKAFADALAGKNSPE